MVGLNLTAFFIYRLFGGFGIFHGLALLSLFTVLVGYVYVIRRKPRDRWLELHYEYVSWSYVGLLAAAVAEFAVRVPAFQGGWEYFWLTVFAGTFLVCFVGGRLISSKKTSAI